MVKTVSQRISELFLSVGTTKPEEIRLFVSMLKNEADGTERAIRRNALFLILVWCLGVLIANGTVTEGAVATFKIEQAKSLLIAWPPLVAWMGYLLASSVMADHMLSVAWRQTLRHHLPKAEELNIYKFFEAKTFLGQELLLDEFCNHKGLRMIGNIWIILIGIFLLVSPILAVSHASYLLIDADVYSGIYPCISIACGVIILFRTYATIISMFKMVD